jgi:CO/xanthine dehydrogenase Mo-binding subunit
VRRGNSYIGAPIEHVEDLRFQRGRGEYVDDVRLDGLWYAVIFRSSVAHAKIKSIDASAALVMPGRAVFTGKDIGPVLPVNEPNNLGTFALNSLLNETGNSFGGTGKPRPLNRNFFDALIERADRTTENARRSIHQPAFMP